MSSTQYTRLAITLHWIHALAFLFLVCWGWWMVDLPKGPDRGFAFALHKSVGIATFMVLIVRALWRFFHRPPATILTSLFAQRLSKVVHLCLYILLLIVPIMGYLSASFTKYKMKFFGFPLPKAGWYSPEINEFFSQTHAILAWSLVVLVVVHILGAFMHSNTLKRMLF